MGDRANVKVTSKDMGEVFLYTHWGARELPEEVRQALKKEWRWDDPQYLTRIIFDVMTESQHGEETGYGISAKCGDGDDRIVTVNIDTQTVTLYSKWSEDKKEESYSFKDFIKLKRAVWPGQSVKESDD